VIDGAENNYPSFESSNHYEVAKYYSITDHLIIPECICVNTGAWEALSDADKTAVKKAAVDAATTQRSLWADREKASRAKVEASGVTVNEVTDKTAFQEAMAPIYEAFLANNPDLAPMVKEIRETK
jgi:TRAP-type C4-dicarboxylate transport system substrate-binding protein